MINKNTLGDLIMDKKLKILTSIFSVILVLIMACSVSVSAFSEYDLSNLPFEYEQKCPQTEQTLSPDIKSVIMQKLTSDVYPDSNAADIVIKYYGTLSNGAMLINHYDKTYSYPKIEGILLNKESDYRLEIPNTNVTFFYSLESQKDEVYLYIDGEFYSFKEAYLAKKIDIKMLGEMVQKLDEFSFMLFDWCDGGQQIGDIDADRHITVKDATEVQKYCVAAIEFSELEKSLADVNGDGTVNTVDATEIQKMVLTLK